MGAQDFDHLDSCPLSFAACGYATVVLYDPSRLLSLAEMIKAEVANLAWVLGCFRKIAAVCGAHENAGVKAPNDAFKQTITNNIQAAEKEFQKYSLLTSLDRLALFKQYVVGIPDYPSKEIERDCEEIVRSAESELHRRYFGYVSEHKAKEHIDVALAWKNVWPKFASTERDAREATACYAFGRNDASVFHSMMVLERGLESLAAKLQVKYPARAWGGVIDDIEAEIKKRQTKLKAKKPSDFLTFLSIAAKEFTYFKDAWRNHTAHARAEYDENDARKVLTHVREFMEHLAKRLKERKR